MKFVHFYNRSNRSERERKRTSRQETADSFTVEYPETIKSRWLGIICFYQMNIHIIVESKNNNSYKRQITDRSAIAPYFIFTKNKKMIHTYKAQVYGERFLMAAAVCLVAWELVERDKKRFRQEIHTASSSFIWSSGNNGRFKLQRIGQIPCLTP